MKPYQRRHFSIGVQLKESTQERNLEKMDKYQRYWRNYENSVEKHFEKQNEIKNGQFLKKSFG
jgi:hypothetical protein